MLNFIFVETPLAPSLNPVNGLKSVSLAHKLYPTYLLVLSNPPLPCQGPAMNLQEWTQTTSNL